MSRLIGGIDRIRAHACRWAMLPLTSVPSAEVTDEDTAAWSRESYDRDLDEDRKANTRRALVLVGLGGLIAAAMVGTAVVAKADPVDSYVLTYAPAVCSTLDEYPSVAGIEGIGMAIVEDGYTPRQAGEIIARSVVGWCPSHMPEVQAFIAKWTTAGTVRA